MIDDFFLVGSCTFEEQERREKDDKVNFNKLDEDKPMKKMSTISRMINQSQLRNNKCLATC